MRSQSQAIARAFAVVGATAALVLCASVPVRAEPAVTVYVPEDICATAWERMPAALRSKTVTIRGVKFDPSKLFELKCNEYKDDLVAKLREPFDKAKEEAAQQLRQPFDDLELGFKSWLAERMRRKMLPRLSPEERERFRRDSAFMQEKQQEWLADPNLETAEYIDAYAKENFGRLYDAYSKYVDLTNGQSKEIVDGLNGILKKAQDRLNRFLALKREAEADPETPWTDLLEKHGFSGSWVDRFKDYEGPIRDLNDRYKVTDAAQIIVGAFQTDDSTAKIDAMFELMATLSSVASDSKVPIVSLFGDIVAGYAKAAKEMLAAINALGERLKARAGYCFGPGVPLGRPGSDRYNEAYAATLQYPRLLLCPLGLGVAPWKDIYFQAAPAADDQLYFWSNSTAFDTGAPDGGGRIGVQETLKLMNGARALGYGVPDILAGNAGPIARVYNVPFSGEGGRRGIPGLMAEAREVMRDIDAKVSRLSGSRVYTGACSPDAVLRHIEAQTGINLAAFRDERDRFGLDRLVMTYAASYAAGRGAFGEGAGGRAGAYDHYRRIQQQLKNVSAVVLHGAVRNTRRGLGATCPECAGAALNIRVSGGAQVRGCEATRADRGGEFVVVAVASAPSMPISLSAQVGSVQGETLLVDDAFLARQGFATGDANIRSTGVVLPIALDVPVRQATAPVSTPGSPVVPGGRRPGTDDLPGQAAAAAAAAAATAARCAAERAKLRTASALIAAGRLEDGERMLADVNVAACPAIAGEVAREKARTATGVVGVVNAGEEARRSCDASRLAQAAARLRTLQHSRLSELAAAIDAMTASLARAEADVAAARSLYAAGDFQGSIRKLEQARSVLDALSRQGRCKELIGEVTSGIDKARRVAAGLDKVTEAIAACDIRRLPSYRAQLDAVKLPHPAMEAKKAEAGQLLAAVASAQKQLSGVVGLSKAGKLAEAESRLSQLTSELARRGLTGCEVYAQAVREAEQVKQARAADAAAQAAIASCDAERIDNLIASARQGGPGAARNLAGLTRAKTECAEKKRKEELADAGERCREKYGAVALAVRTSGGGFNCGCQRPYRIDDEKQLCALPKTREEITAERTALCRRDYGENAIAGRQNRDGTFDCACAGGFVWNSDQTACERQKTREELIAEANASCRETYGPFAVSTALRRDGSSDCICQAGYDWNKANTACERQKTREEIVSEANAVCRESFGPYSIATRPRRDGTSDCICQAGYDWNSANTACVRQAQATPSPPPPPRGPPAAQPCPPGQEWIPPDEDGPGECWDEQGFQRELKEEDRRWRELDRPSTRPGRR